MEDTYHMPFPPHRPSNHMPFPLHRPSNHMPFFWCRTLAMSLKSISLGTISPWAQLFLKDDADPWTMLTLEVDVGLPSILMCSDHLSDGLLLIVLVTTCRFLFIVLVSIMELSWDRSLPNLDQVDPPV